MNYNSIVSEGNLVYSSISSDKRLRQWQIGKTVCQVMFYETTPLTELEKIILKVIDSMEQELFTKEDIGLTLGFDISTKKYGNVSFYEDEAEKSFYNSLIASVFKWKLATEYTLDDDNNSETDSNYVVENKEESNAEPIKYVKLTKLGRIALERGCKFSIYKGKKDLIENNFTKSTNPEDSEFFPFYTELGIDTPIIEKELEKDFDADSIDIDFKDDLIKRIALQSSHDYHIFFAKKEKRWSVDSIYVDLKLYEIGDTFYPIYYCGESIATNLSNILYRTENKTLFGKKIKQALYYRLINNADSVIRYSEIKLFEDEIGKEEFDLIVSDNRTDWFDDDTFNYIIKNELCTAKHWNIISNKCPEEVIIKHIDDSSAEFDIIVLSRKMSFDYIMANISRQVWSLDVILTRDDISKDIAHTIILSDIHQDAVWDWETIVPFLDIDFVCANIDRLNISFYQLTSWLPSEKLSIVLQYPDKQWNWGYVASKLETKDILNSLSIIGDKIAPYFSGILNKCFVSEELKHLCLTSSEFYSITENCQKQGFLFTYSLRDKSYYLWDDKLIHFFESIGILNWISSYDNPGFAQFSYVEWTHDFFCKYQHKIDSESDFEFISKRITDISLITQYSAFKWDWIALSHNPNFANSEEFLSLGKEKVDYEAWLKISGIILSEEFFIKYNHWLSSDKNASFVSKSITDANWIEKYNKFPWNWNVLACNYNILNSEKFCDLLMANKSNFADDLSFIKIISGWVNVANKEIIEKYFFNLSINILADNQKKRLSNIANNLGSIHVYESLWTQLSRRLSCEFITNNIECDWDFSILSYRLLSAIENDCSLLNKYASKWDWNELTKNLSESFIHSHFHEFISYWNKDEIHQRIIHLLNKEDVLDDKLADYWDGYILSSSLSDSTLLDILEKKLDILDWYTVSERLCGMDIDLCDVFKNINVSSELNWNVLNSNIQLNNVFSYANIENTQWDWSILTSRFDNDFVIENLSKYADLWDWEVVFNQVLSKEYIRTEENLSLVKDAVNKIDKDKQIRCWATISKCFSPYELLNMSERLMPEAGYFWDYSYIYEAIENPESFVSVQHSYIDWKAFSSCNAINKMFEYDDSQFVLRTWKSIVKNKLQEQKFHFDYSELTKLPSIQKQHSFFYAITPEKWDWDYISQFGACLLKNNNGEANVRKYKNRLKFNLISSREDIDLDETFIDSYIDEGWDWAALSANESIKISFAFICANEDKPWDWQAISKNKSIKWNKSYLRRIINNPNIASVVSWDDVVAREEIKFDESLVKLIMNLDFSWLILSSNSSFVPTKDFIEVGLEKDGISWHDLSNNKYLDINLVKEYIDSWDWEVLTANAHVIDVNDHDILSDYKEFISWDYVSKKAILSNEFIVKFKDSLNWKLVNKRLDYLELDFETIDCIYDVIDWTILCNTPIKFTKDFLIKHRERIDWYALKHNNNFYDAIKEELYDEFSNELNRVKFVDTLNSCNSGMYSNGKVYHFTHLFNAIEIIKSRKILSRDKAEELEKLKYDAAGSVVHRTSKAHPYVRFYYRPKSPTQFYNECLGWDDTLLTNWKKPKSYYTEACRLNLPKCPMPVFFEFDVREIIAKNPNRCYYSTGNLQTNAASIYSVDNIPDRLNTDYLYYDMSDAFYMALENGDYNRSAHMYYLDKIKLQSQQEFLINEEFDFSNIDSLRIYCFDEFQKDLLIKYLGDNEIISKIRVGGGMYSYANRQLEMKEDSDVISISSDYDLRGGCAYLLVKGGTIINNTGIKNRTSEGAIMYPSVEFSKNDLPSEIYFIDRNPHAGTKEWLIFKA